MHFSKKTKYILIAAILLILGGLLAIAGGFALAAGKFGAEMARGSERKLVFKEARPAPIKSLVRRDNNIDIFIS